MFECTHQKMFLGILALSIYLGIANGAMTYTVLQELTMAGFQFSCRLTSGSVTTTTTFRDAAGDPLGACSAGGNCPSGTTPKCNITLDLSTEIFTVTVPAGYLTPRSNLSGNWTCAHGSDTGYVTYDTILAFESPKGVEVSYTKKGHDAEISFTMSCIYPSANYKIEYKEEPGGDTLKTFNISSNDTRCTNIAADCTTADSRAYGQRCTIHETLKKNYKISVRAEVTGILLSTSAQNILSSEIVLLGHDLIATLALIICLIVWMLLAFIISTSARLVEPIKIGRTVVLAVSITLAVIMIVTGILLAVFVDKALPKALSIGTVSAVVSLVTYAVFTISFAVFLRPKELKGWKNTLLISVAVMIFPFGLGLGIRVLIDKSSKSEENNKSKESRKPIRPGFTSCCQTSKVSCMGGNTTTESNATTTGVQLEEKKPTESNVTTIGVQREENNSESK